MESGAQGAVPAPRVELALRDIRIGYGSEETLHIPALDFPSRQITALLGPVAAGKTSLMRHMAGMSHLTPSCWHCGKVILDGTDVPVESGEEIPAIALLPQKARLYSGTVLENLGVTADDDRLSWWLGVLGVNERISGRLNMDVGLLSLACHRVILILRLLLQFPKALLLDEPLSDVAKSDEAWLLKAIRKLSGKLTVVIISHNKPQARIVADHVALVSGGALAELTPAKQFFQQPSSELGRAWLSSGSPWPSIVNYDDDAPMSEAPEHPPAMMPRSLGFHWILSRRLGGMHQPGLLSDLAGDLAAVAALGVNRLVTLTDVPLELDGVDTHQLAIEHFPIIDMDVPDLEQCIALFDRLKVAYSQGENLVFHCRGGLGRTGLMLACFLIANGGVSGGAAIERVRRLNPNYIQSARQLAFVQGFQEKLRLARLGQGEG